MKRAIILLRVSSEGQTKRAGADEGYSFEVQRDGCYAKARQFEAEVVEKFVGPAQSASKGVYPALREALDFVRDDGHIDYFIVYRLDRFARDELTQFAALAELTAAGCQLVSVTEPIDSSPQGLFSLGILASVNAYRSREDGKKIKEGLTKKAQMGGTPTRAPIGYLNKQRWDGRNDIRYIEVDAERAPHVRWAFLEYETGRWSINALADALYERGLRTRPQGKRAAVRVRPSSLQKILRNPYYIGIVQYQGIERDGTHQPLIDKDTFSRVQAILTAKDHAGERQRRFPHYLKGTVCCGHCGRRFLFSRSRGNGGAYDYFMCGGRHNYKTHCVQPYIQTHRVEDAVADFYAEHVTLPAERIARLRDDLIAGFAAVLADDKDKLAAAQRRLARAQAKRRKLLDLAYNDDIPRDLFREQQDTLTREINAATRTLEGAQVRLDQITAALDDALELAINAVQHYAEADPALRRQLNQAFFVRIFVRDAEIADCEIAAPYRTLLDPDLAAQLERRPLRTGVLSGPGSIRAVLVETPGIEPGSAVA